MEARIVIEQDIKGQFLARFSIGDTTIFTTAAFPTRGCIKDVIEAIKELVPGAPIVE